MSSKATDGRLQLARMSAESRRESELHAGEPSSHGASALLICCQNGHEKCALALLDVVPQPTCSVLLEARAVPSGATPLIAACQRKLTQVVTQMLSLGADVHSSLGADTRDDTAVTL